MPSEHEPLESALAEIDAEVLDIPPEPRRFVPGVKKLHLCLN